MEMTFRVTGMTCEGCAAKVTYLIQELAEVENVQVDLNAQRVRVTATQPVSLQRVQSVLAPYPKYAATAIDAPAAGIADTRKTALSTFWPLILIGLFLVGISSAICWTTSTGLSHWMSTFMGGFFLIFSFFKFLDLRGFVASYQGYDLLAKAWPTYGYVYPFIELALGFGWAFWGHAPEVAVATVVVMGFSAIGVVRAVVRKEAIACACLGTVFNLPMTTVTIVEDVLMVVMALWMLLPMH